MFLISRRISCYGFCLCVIGLWMELLYLCLSCSKVLLVEGRSAAMVLILGRRLNREESGVRDSPAIKRKVCHLQAFPLFISFSLT